MKYKSRQKEIEKVFKYYIYWNIKKGNLNKYDYVFLLDPTQWQ